MPSWNFLKGSSRTLKTCFGHVQHNILPLSVCNKSTQTIICTCFISEYESELPTQMGNQWSEEHPPWSYQTTHSDNTLGGVEPGGRGLLPGGSVGSGQHQEAGRTGEEAAAAESGNGGNQEFQGINTDVCPGLYSFPVAAVTTSH